MPRKVKAMADLGVARPSRGEIETLCVLHAVSRRGCALTDLPARLGLAPSLVEALRLCVESLAEAGWLEMNDEQISLSESGKGYLEGRLAEVGIAPGKSR